MEFLESVGRVALCVMIAVMAAGVAVAIGMLLGLLAAIIKNELDGKDDVKMKEKKRGEPVLESMAKVRSRVLKDNSKISNGDFAEICREALGKFGEPLMAETITSLDLPFVAAALRFWADKTEQTLDVVGHSEAAKQWYQRALSEMNENTETTAVIRPGKDEE